ncbi:threonine/serine exporter family protein [Enterococcus dongliensis]|uniref:threonine/serine exporter family protein n=1 Tax=Enterococcus dongliensis TaxID=2559925 RepID=UPI00288D3758|nr:threonine/serine exporter family protein [Enterococcus dongliensis]MDT2669649.1 threonine/serine exporter family protein [Enterococcus dongliensis]MDT2674995.1 threonine/serine exporter family protein [Enterococcus dongliensis]MDT2703579.1 threonine/serine exporter family protein [Enterococcus dongliensis]
MINGLFQTLAGFLGTISFAILFEVPRRYYVHCGVIGACGWFIYLVIMHFWVAPVTATFIASLALIYLSREASFALKAPVTIFLICGIFCLVPGVGIYNFTYNFFIGDSIKAAQIGIQVLKIAIAIAVGITVGYELSPKFFYSYHKIKKNKNSLS